MALATSFPRCIPVPQCALFAPVCRTASDPYFLATVTRLERDSLPQIRAALFSGSRPTLFAFLRVSRRARRGIVIGESCDQLRPLRPAASLSRHIHGFPCVPPPSPTGCPTCQGIACAPIPQVPPPWPTWPQGGRNGANIGRHWLTLQNPNCEAKFVPDGKAQVRGLCA